MIILDTPVLHLVLQAPETASQIGDCRLVTVQDQDRPVQGLVALEPVIKNMKETPRSGLVQLGEDPADGVRAGSDAPSRRRQNGLRLSCSKAWRLPSRATAIRNAAVKTTIVGITGRRRASVREEKKPPIPYRRSA
jgi:hypothetical protein